MSSDDPLFPPEMGRRRTPSLLLPEEPSPEELAQFWTLSDLDRAEVFKCQGDANQRRFAVQLCACGVSEKPVPKKNQFLRPPPRQPWLTVRWGQCRRLLPGPESA